MRYFLGASAIAVALFSATMFVVAQSNDPYGYQATAGQATLPKTVFGKGSVEEVVGGGIKIILSFLGIVFFLLMVYAGLIWMLARGNEERVTKAKDTVEHAAIGIMLVLASYAIASLVFKSLASRQTTPAEEQAAYNSCEYKKVGHCATSCGNGLIIPGETCLSANHLCCKIE